jgi:hypothetical protein
MKWISGGENMKRITTLAAASLLAMSGAASAIGGDLATQPIELEALQVGTGDNGFGMEPNEYQMQTGQSYRLKIQAVGWHECNWQAPRFFQNAWLRKIEAGNMEIKVAQLNELEMDQNSNRGSRIDGRKEEKTSPTPLEVPNAPPSISRPVHATRRGGQSAFFHHRSRTRTTAMFRPFSDSLLRFDFSSMRAYPVCDHSDR